MPERDHGCNAYCAIFQFYDGYSTKPKIELALMVAGIYTALVGIADERWKHLSLAIAEIAFLPLTTDVLALV